MCDTFVAAGSATLDGSIILAKNSDREPNEAQLLKHIPSLNHIVGEFQQCTYISIPKTPHTNEILISKPFWMWGCEMGVNSHGLAIGNEAVFTKERREKIGLTGMDMIRIALERARSSRDALNMIAHLILNYGQGGNCGLTNKMYYHNSFIIADTKEVWVMETANKQWAAKKIDGIYSISNGLTIEDDFDISSKGIEDYALKKRYIKKNETFNFRKAFSDKLYTHFSRCSSRCSRTLELLNRQFGKITPSVMMEILRDHGDDNRCLHPHETSMGTVCMHASQGPFRPSQSTSAMIFHLRDRFPVHWATGTSGTCISTFKPFILSGKELDFFPNNETRTMSYDSHWWKHELLHRQAIIKYSSWMNTISLERNELEKSFIEKESELFQKNLKKNKNWGERAYEFSRECFTIFDEKCSIWIKRLNSIDPDKGVSYLFRHFWKKQNRLALMPENFEPLNE